MEKKHENSFFLNNRSIDIEFENVSYEVKQLLGKKKIIKGVSGKFYSGELTAIMGPSGAGKTTLLNILTGLQTRDIKGSIRCSKSDKIGASQYKKESCYILQEDTLPCLFTAVEIMNIAADLKLRNILKKQKDYLINNILGNLGLSTCKNTKCQHLSGGQKKRLSIALELINNPTIMFLDEPTTGLDSLTSVQCIQMLKKLAAGGRTIICTIHQPTATIYDMFDHVYVMAEGYCVYQGSSSNTVSYLSSLNFNCPQYHNPADYLLEVVNGDYGNHIDILKEAANDQKWSKREQRIGVKGKEGIDVICPVVDHKAEKRKIYQTPSEFTKFWILLSRCGKQIRRDWTISHMKLLLHILVGIFLGVTFLDCGSNAAKVHSNLGFMLCSVVYLCFTSLMPAILKFPSELAILRKERFNNWYKLKTYFAAFLVSDIPVQAGFCIAYTTTSYFISSQPVEWRRFIMVLNIQMLVTLTSSSLGIFLGTILSPVNGIFWGSIILAIMLTSSGFFIIFTHMSNVMYLMTYTSFLSFAVEGIMQAVYGYNRNELICRELETFCLYKYPDKLLQEFGMEKRNYWIDVVYLLVCFVVLRSLTFFTLRRRLSEL